RGRDQAHREMMQTVQEMKKRLPSERRGHRKASTVEALNYALNCVKQVQANSEYYKLLMSNGVVLRHDATACNLEELESITSEHTLKNTDTFVAVFSLASGRIVYISEQASSILNCKRKFLDSAKFVELLYHQDINIFYSHTAQPHLPPWNMGTDSAAILFECARVRSFFCRIRSARERSFCFSRHFFHSFEALSLETLQKMRPLLCNVYQSDVMISSHDLPKHEVAMDVKVADCNCTRWIFILQVSDSAVPLLGYLPQDLIGTSVLACLHPEDRPLMLAMHRKILKYAGQSPFDHSPVRFRCQNGDYVTLDTSWSSFINPWSRKVAFVIGRHKVRTGPLNEDVFAPRCKGQLPVIDEEIKELQAQIYKLFLQPVHNNGSSGYGSLGSNGSHEHYISVASSSDSNGNVWEDAQREPVRGVEGCYVILRPKKWGLSLDLSRTQQTMRSCRYGLSAGLPLLSGKQEVRGHLTASQGSSRKQPHVPSYQQINCVDSIIRYLESYSGPALKRKCESLSNTTSSSSEEDRTPPPLLEGTQQVEEESLLATGAPDSQVSAGSGVTTTAAVVGAPLTDLTLSTKAMSVVSVTSQCSYSSTIVHVPQPESEVTALEDAPMGSEQADPPRVALCSAAAPEEFRKVGLTKEVLSAHTQKEEQDYVDRFQHRILQSPYSSYLQQDSSSKAPSHHHGDYVPRPASTTGWRKSKTGKPKHKRPKPQGSSDSYASPPESCRARRPPAAPASPLYQAWTPPEASQARAPSMGFLPPVVMPFQPAYFPLPAQVGGEAAGGMTPNSSSQQGGNPLAMQGVQPMQPAQPVHSVQAMQTMQPPLPVQQMQGMVPYVAPVMAVFVPSFPNYPGYPMYPQEVGSVGPASSPSPQAVPCPSFTPAPFPETHPPQGPYIGPPEPPLPSLSPQAPSSLGEDPDSAQPPPLFSSSRSSSPLQLNLLQEELPKPAEPQGGAALPESLHEPHTKGDDAPSESGNQDNQSTSSELLDLLLHEDSRSGTGSNVSGSGSGESGGSLGSGSNGSGSNGTSASHTGSSQSGNSSKYFASNDSSDTSRSKARKSQEVPERASFEKRAEDSLWTMIQHTPEPIMMNYQLLPRDQAQVLTEDRKKLLLLQPLQPWFTEEQKEELAEVHPWICQHGLPPEIDTQGCISCNRTADPPAEPQTA
uniref:Period circadian clock 3 n=1 Tax=Lepisosteus oculatus TaxID=7918 RepID=W5M3Y2_LEPOC